MTIRIIGGAWGGRRIATPPGDDTRPATDAFRGRLINILGPDLTGTRVLDLFSGSGAFGLECLSRGADRAVMVEKARPALDVIRANVKLLAPEAGRAVVVAADVYKLPALVAEHGPFDIVIVAPPYPHFARERARIVELLASLAADPRLLAADGVVVVQSSSGDFAAAGVAGLESYDARRMGRTDFTFLRPGMRPA